jgi:hypothetical protein
VRKREAAIRTMSTGALNVKYFASASSAEEEEEEE